AVYAASQGGCLPPPVQVAFGLAGLRYFGGAFFAVLRAVGLPAALRAVAAAAVPNSSSTVHPADFAIATSLRRTVAAGLRLPTPVVRFFALVIGDSSSRADRPFRSIAIFTPIIGKETEVSPRMIIKDYRRHKTGRIWLPIIAQPRSRCSRASRPRF